MGAARSSWTARAGRSRRLTEQELATLAVYEHHFAQADPELLARLELLWSLAADTVTAFAAATWGTTPL